MQVFRGVPERATTSTVLTIGNFDGVHRGHRALLAELKAKARELALPATVLTFEPHPRELFAPTRRRRGWPACATRSNCWPRPASIASMSVASTASWPR
jgi:cytidyltransferase-like protein